VSGICGAILRGQTAEALSRLYEQAETGKDLSRLLADVIFHFRNVLVHKVDPEIAARDLPVEIAEDLAGQAALVTNEKLMLIIDQFAEVEGGMKWALNKRLYFEIGIIRATQVLGESSLSDVIMALRNSLEGSSAAAPAASGVAAQAAATQMPRPSMAEAVRAAITSPPATTVEKPAVSPPDFAGRSSPRYVSTTEEAMVSPPLPAVATSEPAAGNMAPGPELWLAAREEFSRKYPLQGGYAAEASFLEVNGRNFVIGVPEEHRMAATNLERPLAKAALEDILARLSGTKYAMKVEVRADLVSAPDPDPPVLVLPAAEPAVEKLPAKSAKAHSGDEAAGRQSQLDEEFRNDPLIQEALRLFDARIIRPA
jgi:DNA polymerase-3 subunit gamma/tau